MIEEIFITQKEKVLVGDPEAYPKNPAFPTHVIDNKQLTQYKFNDIVVSALYTNLDVFSVLDYLEKLCKEIENDVSELTAENIREYYFSVLEVVNRNQLVIQPKERSKTFSYIQSNDIYVDVIETYNVVINNETGAKREVIIEDSQEIHISNRTTLLRNEVLGLCFIKPNFLDAKTVKLIINKNNLNYVSENKLVEKFNKIEVEMDITNRCLEVIKYITKSRNSPPVNLIKENGVYKLTTDEDTVFEHLELQIPVPLEIKKIKIKNSKGHALHDEKLSVVIWKFKNEKVNRSTISLEIQTFSEQKCSNEVNVSFTIPKSTKTHLKIEKAVCLGHPAIKVWIKYDICSGTYRIRV